MSQKWDTRLIWVYFIKILKELHWQKIKSTTRHTQLCTQRKLRSGCASTTFDRLLFKTTRWNWHKIIWAASWQNQQDAMSTQRKLRSGCASTTFDRLLFKTTRWNWHKIIWAASWQNQQDAMCAQRRLKSAWAFAQSDQSLRCPHAESLGP